MANGIDDEVYDLMGIDPDDRRHFAEEIAFRQCLPPMDEDDDDEGWPFTGVVYSRR